VSELPMPVDVLGVPVHPISRTTLLDALVEWGASPTVRHVFYMNVYGINLAQRDAAFRSSLAEADLVFCDGYGVKWGARLLDADIPERMTPPDWIDELAARTAAAGQSVFAIGDEPGVADAFQKALAAKHAGYRDAGSHHGFFTKTGAENDAVIDRINASGANHLLVGFGMPLQETWSVVNAARLRVGTVIAVGALYRWYSGAEQRAPRWMTDHGLEWLARLARHPVRHFERYVIGNPLFVLRVLRQRWFSREM
jgi:N-acetylglucosaminyldiphosphoundecaprenol N-acetyl-beta-D-mannosaminyltransferase